MSNKDHLYIFVHLHKTGGTTLNRHIIRNYKKEEILILSFDKLGIGPFNNKVPEIVKAAKNYVSRMPKAQKAKIKVIIGHFVPYGVHKYFDKTPRYITIIRDPIKRAFSLYNYFRTQHSNEYKKKKGSENHKRFLLVDGKVPTFKVWFQKKYRKQAKNLLSRPVYDYYLNLGYIRDTRSIKACTKELLEKFYFVGITERLNEGLFYLYGLLGINKFFIDQNISKKFVKSVGGDTLKMLKKKYPFDFVLYKAAIEANKGSKLKNPEYYDILNQVRIRRRILLPFTQVIFDFKESMHRLSAYVRTKSVLYSRFMDYIKGKNK